MSIQQHVLTTLPVLLLHAIDWTSARDVTANNNIGEAARNTGNGASASAQSLFTVTSQFTKSFVTSEAIKSHRLDSLTGGDAAGAGSADEPSDPVHARYRPLQLSDVTDTMNVGAHVTKSLENLHKVWNANPLKYDDVNIRFV